MLCPRCRKEIPERAVRCASCGAPLALRDEPPPKRLEITLPIDRREPSRARGWAEAEPQPAPARSDPPWAAPQVAPSGRGPAAPAGVDRDPPHAPGGEASSWALGQPLEARHAEPAPPPPRSARADAIAPPLPDDRDGLRLEPDVGAVEVHLQRASAGRRAVAWGVDLVPLLLLGAWLWRTGLGAVPAPTGGIDGLLDLVARERALALPLAAVLLVGALVYATLFHALMGATLGKWVAGIRVVGPDGRRPGWKRSAARSAAAVISVGALGMGCLLALFTRSGRALHDLMAGTYVVEAP